MPQASAKGAHGAGSSAYTTAKLVLSSRSSQGISPNNEMH